MVGRADSRLAPSQWETSLQSNAVSHWLGANLESALVGVEVRPTDAYIWFCKLTTNASDNGLSSGRCQAIIWTNAGIFLIGPLGITFNENFIEINKFSFNKNAFESAVCKMASVSSRSQCLNITLCSSWMNDGTISSEDTLRSTINLIAAETNGMPDSCVYHIIYRTHERQSDVAFRTKYQNNTLHILHVQSVEKKLDKWTHLTPFYPLFEYIQTHWNILCTNDVKICPKYGEIKTILTPH